MKRIWVLFYTRTIKVLSFDWLKRICKTEINSNTFIKSHCNLDYDYWKFVLKKKSMFGMFEFFALNQFKQALVKNQYILKLLNSILSLYLQLAFPQNTPPCKAQCFNKISTSIYWLAYTIISHITAFILFRK